MSPDRDSFAALVEQREGELSARRDELLSVQRELAAIAESLADADREETRARHVLESWPPGSRLSARERLRRREKEAAAELELERRARARSELERRKKRVLEKERDCQDLVAMALRGLDAVQSELAKLDAKEAARVSRREEEEREALSLVAWRLRQNELESS